MNKFVTSNKVQELQILVSPKSVPGLILLLKTFAPVQKHTAFCTLAYKIQVQVDFSNSIFQISSADKEGGQPFSKKCQTT